MSSQEFVLQLIESSLNGMGYAKVSQYLQQEIRSKNLQLHQTQLSATDASHIEVINWVSRQLIDGRYGAVQCYVECSDFSPQNPQLLALNLPFIVPVTVLLASNDSSLPHILVYLLKRWHFLELVLAHTIPRDRESLVNYLKLDLLPYLDKISEVNPQLSAILPANLLPNLTRAAESKLLLGLAMDYPYEERQAGDILSNSEYFLGVPLVFTPDENLSVEHILRQNLITTFLGKIFRLSDVLSTYTTTYNIPSNYIQDIIFQASTYQKLQNPYYLPPRTKTEKLQRLSDNDEPFVPQNQALSVNQYFKSHYFSSKIIHNLTTNTNEVWCAKFSPLGKFLVTGSGDGKLMIYDVVDNFKFITKLESTTDEDNAVFASGPKPSGTSKSIVSCCWDPHEEYIVSCCFDTVVRVWSVEKLHENTKRRNSRSSSEIKNYKLVSCFTLGESIRIWCCAFLPDTLNNGGRFILGSPDKVLKLYDINGTELFDFHANIYESNFHEEDVADDVNMQEELEEEHNSNEEANSDTNEYEDKKLRKPVDKKAVEKKLQSYFNRIVDLAISPNGKILIIIDRNRQLQFYAIPKNFSDESTTTTRIASITLRSNGTSCSISKNGKYLLLSTGPEELQVWDISGLTDFESGSYDLPILYRKFYAHNHGDCTIRSSFGYLVQETNEEELVLSGSHDGFVYVWKLHTGQVLTRLDAHEGTCNMVDWNLQGPKPTKKNNRDYGKLWCSVGDDKNVKIWGPSDWE